MAEKKDSATKQVLELIGLAHDEVNTYFKITGRGPVMVGEISLIADVSEERAGEIASTLYHKGLLKQIPGKTPIYEALPPYVALLGQIHQFKETIKTFQQVTPINIQERFDSLESHSDKLKKLDDYRTYIQVMKTKLPQQIKTQFERFENELEQVKRFQDVRGFILNLKEIVPAEITKDFGLLEESLDSMKTEISSRFEKQFRIGALKSMAEKIVSRVISEQFVEITKIFKNKFVQTTQNMLDQVIGQLGTITETAGEISTDLGTVFSDIEVGLKTTLEDLDRRVTGVYDDIINGIQDLKDLFKKEIFETIQNDIISNIIRELESSELTMNEFWERSKEASLLSFKDVWFVRSVEGIKAQINESLTRVKMRVHIIAPKLEDIDLVALSQLKSHVNIRISTNFDLSDPADKARFNQFIDLPNFAIRHYGRENLWSINKDFEEVIVCVLSKTEEGEHQVAGMGSVLEEHVKLFAGVLEDVWIQSKKLDQVEVLQSLKTTIQPQSSGERSTPIPRPSLPKTSEKLAPMTTESPSSILTQSIQPKPAIQPDQISRPVEPKPQTDYSTGFGGTTDDFLTSQLDKIINDLPSMTGYVIASSLQSLQDDILERKGFSVVLRQMRLSITELKANPNLLNPTELQGLMNKIKFWRSKLRI
ncbi:MAG: helix-turn-helix domain-containing protein [Promethearchaeota archaeon]|jgi:sugar-specific transcriptional regulator TrmB